MSSPGRWATVVEALVRLCKDRAAEGAKLAFDPDGARELAALLTVMAEELDQAYPAHLGGEVAPKDPADGA